MMKAVKQIIYPFYQKLLGPNSVLKKMTGADKKVPPALHIEVTSACNLRCEYCVLDANMPDKTVMSVERFEALRPYFKGARHVYLSGLAEPLLNRNIAEFIRTIRSESPSCRVAIFSNAALLTEKLSEALITSGLDSFNFSLDGVEPGVIDGIRKGSQLVKVIENVRTFGDIKKRLGLKRPEIIATMVLQKKNYRQLSAVVELAAGLGAARLDVNGLEPYTEDMVEHILWEPGGVPEDLPDVLEKAAEVSMKCGLPVGLASLVPSTKPACLEVCKPFILADGDVVPCAALAYDRAFFYRMDASGRLVRARGVCKRKVFGNVFKTPLKELWAAPDYKGFRERVLNGAFPQECSTCLIKHRFICVRADLTPNELYSQSKEVISRQRAG